MNNTQRTESDGMQRSPDHLPHLVLLSEVDLPDVLALERSCFKKIWSLEQLRSSFCRGSLILLGAKNPERLLGYVAFQIVESDMELLNVAVLPAWRSQGLGRDLVRAALKFGLEQGVKACFLEAAADNIPALSLYRGLGFTTTGIRRNYFQEQGRNLDAVMMSKELRIAPEHHAPYLESEEK